MFLLDAVNPALVVNTVASADNTMLLFWLAFGFDIAMILFIMYQTTLEITGIRLVKVKGGGITETQRLSEKAIDGDHIDTGVKRFRILHKPRFAVAKFGIHLPVYYVIEELGCTIDFLDPRDPTQGYLSPETLKAGQKAIAEKELNTLRTESDKWNLIIIAVGCIAVGVVAGQYLLKGAV